jgi:ribosomal protein L37AE/L43A
MKHTDETLRACPSTQCKGGTTHQRREGDHWVCRTCGAAITVTKTIMPVDWHKGKPVYRVADFDEYPEPDRDLSCSD